MFKVFNLSDLKSIGIQGWIQDYPWEGCQCSGGANIQFSPNCPKKCMKLKTFWAIEWRHTSGAPPLDLARDISNQRIIVRS